MITGEIFISTTWAASTSFIPFDIGMRNAHDVKLNGVANRGFFATTAYIHGVWDYQIFEEGFKNSMADTLNADGERINRPNLLNESIHGMGGEYLGVVTNAFTPGTVLETEVRKVKALKSSPNRSGVQVSRRMVKGNKLVIRYIAQGELVRP